MNTLKRVFPLFRQLADYDKAKLKGDLSAGLTVGVMLIPQGMAYAMIAGLPPIYGLYASLVPLIIYAMLGTSRQLAVGPVAMVSLLVAAGVAPLAGGDMTQYIGLALLLSLMIGALQVGLGLIRAGFLTNFLSHPVLAGFTSAAALIIGLNQLKHLLGVQIPRSNYVHEIIGASAAQLGNINGTTLAIGLAGILLLVALKRWKRTLPGALFVVILSTAAVWFGGLSDLGVKIVGDVPGGLPVPTMPAISIDNIRALFPTALAITLVGYMESIAVAKVYASKHRYPLEANRELIALGAANIGGALFQAYPTTGGFSRTAVNDQAGAQTGLATLISAGIITITLMFLTGLFYFLPQAVLAAIVMVAVWGLIEWKEAVFLWKTNRLDFSLMLLTFIATLALGIEEGILVGVIASLMVVLNQSSRPHAVVEGQIPNSNTYRNLLRNPTAKPVEGIVIFRMDASLYFANTAYFKERIEEIANASPRPRAIVLNAYPINRIDSSAVHVLKDLLALLRSKHIALYIAGIKGPVMDALNKSMLSEAIGQDHFFMEVHEAVTAAQHRFETQNKEADTPFLKDEYESSHV